MFNDRRFGTHLTTMEDLSLKAQSRVTDYVRENFGTTPASVSEHRLRSHDIATARGFDPHESAQWYPSAGESIGKRAQQIAKDFSGHHAIGTGPDAHARAEELLTGTTGMLSQRTRWRTKALPEHNIDLAESMLRHQLSGKTVDQALATRTRGVSASTWHSGLMEEPVRRSWDLNEEVMRGEHPSMIEALEGRGYMKRAAFTQALGRRGQRGLGERGVVDVMELYQSVPHLTSAGHGALLKRTPKNVGIPEHLSPGYLVVEHGMRKAAEKAGYSNLDSFQAHGWRLASSTVEGGAMKKRDVTHPSMIYDPERQHHILNQAQMARAIGGRSQKLFRQE